MGKVKEEKAPSVSRKPQFKGMNHPADLHKAFRGSGNWFVINSVLERNRNGRGYFTSVE